MTELTIEKFMTVKEIANITGQNERTIRNHIAKYFPDIMENGKITRLNETQCAIISASIKKSHNLESTYQVTTDLEMQIMSKKVEIWREKKISELSAQLDEAKPKVEFYDAVTGSKDAIDIGIVAKVLDVGIGRNQLFQFLRDNNILMKNNIPYQRYIDAEFFRVIESKYVMPDGENKISFKTLVYQIGVDYIRKLLKEKYVYTDRLSY
jgi:phage antirepressor YoqD-like protein